MLNERKANSTDCVRLNQYLKDDGVEIRRCVDATANWRYLYNGLNATDSPPVQLLNANGPSHSETGDSCEKVETTAEAAHNSHSAEEPPSPEPCDDGMDIYSRCLEQLTSCLNVMNLTSPGQSSGYESFNFQSQSLGFAHDDRDSYFSKEVQEDLEFWSMMRCDNDDDDVSTNYRKTVTKVGGRTGRNHIRRIFSAIYVFVTRYLGRSQAGRGLANFVDAERRHVSRDSGEIRRRLVEQLGPGKSGVVVDPVPAVVLPAPIAALIFAQPLSYTAAQRAVSGCQFSYVEAARRQCSERQ